MNPINPLDHIDRHQEVDPQNHEYEDNILKEMVKDSIKTGVDQLIDNGSPDEIAKTGIKFSADISGKSFQKIDGFYPNQVANYCKEKIPELGEKSVEKIDESVNQQSLQNVKDLSKVGAHVIIDKTVDKSFSLFGQE